MSQGLPHTALGPTLETERLLLRPPTAEDFDAWAELMADETQTRFIGGTQPAAVVWRGVMAMIGSWASQGYAMFSVIERSTGCWVGRVGPWQPYGWPGAEIGWTLTAAASGKGYATEAANATMDWAFEVLDWPEVIHSIDPANAPSIAVARRLGSRYLRTGCELPPPFEATEVQIWGQTREEWRARRSAGA